MKNKLFNKVRICIMTLFIALSTCLTSTPVKAASYVVNFGAPTGISYTASGPALDGTNTTDWNANYPTLLINGAPVFCLDPSQLVFDGVGGYTESDFPTNLRSQMNLIGLHGYFEHGQTSDWYMASQFMIWELRGWTINTTNLVNYASMKAEIQNRINHHYDKPNFVNIPSSITVGQTITLTDTNNVLERFDITPVAGVIFNKNGNQLSITASIDAPDSISIYMESYAQGNGTKSSVVYRIPGMPNQVVGMFNYKDPTPYRMNIKVEKYGSLKLIKQDEDGTLVPNTTFALSANADMSSPIGSYSTGVDGSVTNSELIPGTYYVQETAVPSHLVLDSTIKSVVIKPNETTTYTATNNWIKGYIKVVKKDIDTGKTVTKANTTFSLYKNDGTYVQDITTDATGMVATGLLRYGDYYLLENTAPDGYTHSDQKLVYQIRDNGNTYTAELSNKRATGSISIKKEDSVIGNTAQGEATLQGAVYDLKARTSILDPADGSVIYAKDSVVATLTTDENAKASIDNLYLGDYYLKEKTPSNGYTLDPTEYDVLLSYADQNTSVVTKTQTVKERVIAQAFELIKVSDNGSGEADLLAGVEFTVKSQKDIDAYGSWEKAPIAKNAQGKTSKILVTDKKGYALSEEMPFGTYIVRETKVPDDLYKIPDFKVVVNKDSRDPQTWRVFNDVKFRAVVAIVKKDADNDKTITLSGAKFKIKNLDKDEYVGSWVWNPIPHYVDSWTTDENGFVMTDSVLDPGNYQLEEVESPDGYLLAKPIKFKISMNGAFETLPDGSTPVITIVMKDEKPTGSTKLIKSDKDSAETLSGVQYQLTAAKDIIDVADGSIIYNEGDSVSMDISENGYYLTNELGEINVEGLPLGSYTWKETKALDGYVQDKKEYTFELKQKDDVQKVYTHEQELTNQETKVEILKEDTNSNALVGAHLRLVDEDEKDVYTWISDKDAIKLNGLLVGNEYTLYEDEAPSGYVISKPVKFKIKNTTDTQEIKLLDNQINASKTDIDGKRISGAKMQVVSTKTKNVVDQWTSSDEAHYINNLVEGHEYILRELEAPQGYVLAKDVKFTVNDKKEIQTISMIDKQVTALKIDEDGSVLPGAKMQVVSTKTKDIVDEWTSTGKAHNISNLIEGNSYILRELEAPEGLELAEDIEFTVNDKKATQALEMSDKYITSEIKVNKVDQRDHSDILKVAEFTIYKDKECTQPIITEKTDTSNGIATFKKLRYGTYYIKETAAPVGYELSKEVIEVTIDDDWVAGTDKQRTIIFPDKHLPGGYMAIHTGDNTNLLGYVFLCSMAIAFVSLILAYKRKQKKASD